MSEGHEAWRLLRPGGQLGFLGNHPFAMLCQDFAADEPASRELHAPYFDMHRIDWDDGDDQGVEFNLTISEWIQLFRSTGFDVVDDRELRSRSTRL